MDDAMSEIARMVQISHRRMTDALDRWKEELDRAIEGGDPVEVMTLIALTGPQLAQIISQVQAMPIAEQLGTLLSTGERE
jgi:hypothetical protein